MEQILHVQRVVDRQAKGVYVERECNLFVVSAPAKIPMLDALDAVSKYIEREVPLPRLGD